MPVRPTPTMDAPSCSSAGRAARTGAGEPSHGSRAGSHASLGTEPALRHVVGPSCLGSASIDECRRLRHRHGHRGCRPRRSRRSGGEVALGDLAMTACSAPVPRRFVLRSQLKVDIGQVFTNLRPHLSCPARAGDPEERMRARQFPPQADSRDHAAILRRCARR